jgi:hypothetical protein
MPGIKTLLILAILLALAKHVRKLQGITGGKSKS